MRVRFLADENFDHKTIAGLKRRDPDLDIVTVQDVGLRHADDPEVLEWAAQEGRLVITRDVRTMVDHASMYPRLRPRPQPPFPGNPGIPAAV